MSCIDQVNEFNDILQLVIVELVYKVSGGGREREVEGGGEEGRREGEREGRMNRGRKGGREGRERGK